MDGDLAGGAQGLASRQPPQISQEIAAEILAPKRSTSMSAQVGDLMRALAVAQGKMVNPRKDREVTVRPKDPTHQAYKFRYSTLGAINDMIREPLAESGIAVTHQHWELDRRPGVLTRIWFGDQYLGSWLPMIIGEKASMQGLGSASSFCERYNIKGLLNIASDEDDDANIAMGNGAAFSDVDAPASVQLNDEQRALWAYERLLQLTETVRLDDRPTAIQLMRLWQDKLELFTGMRDSHPDHWRKMLDRVHAALMRGMGTQHGRNFAWAWQAIAEARSYEERDVLNREYHQTHAEGVAALKKQCPQAVSLLLEHIRYYSERIEIEERERQAKLAAKRELEREIAEVEARAAAKPPSTAPEPVGLLVAPPEAHTLLDWTGDIASDALDDPAKFARAYVNQWLATPAESREALGEQNDAALAWVSRFAAAATILEECVAAAPTPTAAGTPVSADAGHVSTALLDGDDIPDWDDKPLRVLAPVSVPMKANGQMDCLGYAQAAKDSLEAVCDVPSMQAWLAANEPVYLADKFPIGTRTKVQVAVTARKRVLGMVGGAG